MTHNVRFMKTITKIRVFSFSSFDLRQTRQMRESGTRKNELARIAVTNGFRGRTLYSYVMLDSYRLLMEARRGLTLRPIELRLQIHVLTPAYNMGGVSAF